LGRVSLETQPKQLVYEPTLTLEEGLGHPVSDVYKLSALVRIGAAGHPSLITGLVEGLILETYDA
jgi:hypothetical protein